MKLKRTKQCAKCPWRKDVDPHNIPNGYCETKHAALSRTIAKPGDISGAFATAMSVMACHETHNAHCVGWLMNQLGPGNNLCPDHRDKQAGKACLACEIETLNRKLESLRAALAEREWKTMESAPRDGTRIILGFDYEAYLFTASSGYWTDHNGGGWVRQCQFQPTHWMPMQPLPAAPEQTTEDTPNDH